MSMTIKQLADTLGVSKTAIRKKLDEAFVRDYTTRDDSGIIIISDDGVDVLKTRFRKPAETAENVSDNTESKFTETAENVAENSGNATKTLIDVLTEQLKAKDSQIAELSQKLDNEQKLHLQTQQRFEQAMRLLSPPAPAQETVVQTTENVAENHKKPGLFARIFGRK